MLISCIILSPAFSQTKEVTGVVSDKNGNPLEKATISVKGENTATTSNANGTFKINVASPNAILLISYLGSKPVEFSVAGKTVVLASINVETKLGEVVVIGYGKAKRVNLTSAQTTVSAKDIEKTVNTTVEQAIQGRSPGVYVTQNSGQPGGGMSVTIRGISSITGNTEPLYVIDGVQIQGQQVSFGAQSSSNPLAGLNPADIDDIQIETRWNLGLHQV